MIRTNAKEITFKGSSVFQTETEMPASPKADGVTPEDAPVSTRITLRLMLSTRRGPQKSTLVVLIVDGARYAVVWC